MQECFRIYERNKQLNTHACLIAVHALAVLGLICMLAGFHGTPPWVLMIVCALVTIVIPAWKNSIPGNIAFVTLLFLTGIYIVVFRSWFMTGVYQLANNGIALYNYNYGKEIFYYSLPDSINEEQALSVFLCYLIVLIGMMLKYILDTRHIVVFAVYNLLEVMIVLFFKDQAAGIACIFACMAVLGAVMWSNSGTNNEKKLVLYMFFCLTTGLLISIYYYVEGSYTSNLTVAKMRQSAVTGAWGVLYGEQELPQGNLSKSASYVGDDETKLMVTVSEPGVYYLKGYVGGKYKNGVWNEIDRVSYSDTYEGVFHWMKERGFHPLSQNSEYISMAKAMDGFDSERIEMQVDNISASKRYIYIPYGLTTDSLGDFSNINRDMNIYSSDRNMKTYKVEFDDYDIAKAFAYENPEWINMSSSDSSINDFRDAQVEYMTFVYDNYLDIAPEFEKYFKGMLDKNAVNGYVTITNEIRKWLEDKTLVSDNVKTNDYLMYFLTRTREGNSSFYASAGTLMYRYYGIPARYVEGYLADVNEDYVHESHDDGIIYTKELNGANVHAWVEIYRDGIGWIPVDVTPGFYTELEVTKQVQMKQQQIAQEQQEKEDNEEKEQKKHKVKVLSILKIICLVTFAICVVIIIIITLRSRIICFRRNRILQGDNMEKAVVFWTCFVKQLLRFDSKEENDLSVDIIEILQRYRYRDGIITDEDYHRMIDFAYGMQKGIYEKEGKRNRIKMKYILGLI